MADSGLKEMFLAQRPLLLRMLKVRLASVEDAEDVLQDMWLRLEQIGPYPVGNPAAFLFRVAANLATDRRIAARRHQARGSAWADHQPKGPELPDPERALIAQWEWETIDRIISRMPPRMATALRLFRLEGVRQRAIAEQLGISVSAVEKLLQQAYRIIFDQMRKSDGDRDSPRRQGIEGGADGDA